MPLYFRERAIFRPIFEGISKGKYGKRATQRRPCGYLGDSHHQCRCSGRQIEAYRSRISGPLLDRIDIHIEVPAVNYRELSSDETGESSFAIRDRVNLARGIQKKRFHRGKAVCNASMSSRHIRSHCKVDDAGHALLQRCVDKLGMSARAHSRILKVARTIADLEGSDNLQVAHLSEAVQYRTLDRKI